MPASSLLPLRSLREEPSFTRSCAELDPNPQRVDELLEAIKWRIARDAEGLPLVGGGPFRLAKAQRVARELLLCVLFTINSAELCSLWWVYTTEDPELREEEEE